MILLQIQPNIPTASELLVKNFFSLHMQRLLREKRPYSEFFWSVFLRIRIEYGPEKLRTRTFYAVVALLFEGLKYI